MHASKPSTRTDVSRPREYRLTLGRFGLPRRIPEAAALYRYVVRDAFWMPLTGREIDEPTGTFARVGASSRARRRTAISTSRRPLGSSARRGSRRCIGCGNSAASQRSGRCGPRRSATTSSAEWLRQSEARSSSGCCQAIGRRQGVQRHECCEQSFKFFSSVSRSALRRQR